MFIWALRYWKYIALIIALVSVLGALWAWGASKYRQGWDECTAKQELAEKQSVETRDEIKTKNHRVGISDIDKRLIDNWLYSE